MLINKRTVQRRFFFRFFCLAAWVFESAGNKESVKRERRMLMNSSRIRRMAAVILTLAALYPRSPVIAEGDTVTTVNHIGTGNVSIRLDEYRINAAGTEEPISENGDRRSVLPGETVSKISRITVNGHKCWIRAKVMTEGEERIQNLDPSWVKLFDDDNWVQKGEYWYRTKPAEHGEAVRFTKEVKIPPEVDSSNAEFHVIIWADAVQYDNFSPDFNAAEPWFGTVIETSAYQTYRNGEAGDTHFFVSYEGGAQGLIANSDDLFRNFQILMPGDHVNDSVVIGNGYTRPVRLFFRIEGGTDEELAKHVKLKIHAGETQIWSGTLSEAMNEIYLAYMTPKWTAVLTYELEVPEDLKNEFELQDASQKWIFRAEISDARNMIPRTDDPENLMRYGIGLALSVLLAAGIGVYLKRNSGGL